LHVLLKAQEGGALGEADGKGRQRDISHCELGAVAGAPALDEFIEAARVQAPRNAATAPTIQVMSV
jgi:hypothetical protein